MQPKKTLLAVIGTLFLLSVSSLKAHTATTPSFQQKSIFEHLQDGPQVLEITLKTDLATLINNRKHLDYLPATFQIAGSSITWNIDVRLRGKFRKRICDVPPIKLKFSERQLAGMGFNDQFNKLKLVTHCLESREGEQNVFKEYLAYQMYSQLTPNSYRTRLVRIHYLDNKGQMKKMTRYGFILEPTGEMANRIGGTECDCREKSSYTLHAKTENIMSVFQYMIGNEDWRTEMQRNVKLVVPTQGGAMIPVPYDFDFAGFVNASYARPRSDLGSSRITERYFLGQPSPGLIMEKTMRKIQLYQRHFGAMIGKFELLRNTDREELIAYVDSFYYDIPELLHNNAEQFKNLDKNYVVVGNLNSGK